MKRFTNLLFIIFSRWGFIAFMLYYTIFYLITLNIFPIEFMQSVAQLVNPYYVPIRYVSFITNIIICFITLRFIFKYIKKENYIIRKKTLSFIIAISLIQFISLFSHTNLPPMDATTEALMNLEAFSTKVNMITIENIALLLTGYILAFYIGALSRGNFYGDVVLAAKIPKK